MSILVIALLLSISVVVCWLDRYKLTPLVYTSGILSLILVGYGALDVDYRTSTLPAYCGAVFLFLFGCYVYRLFPNRRSIAGAPERHTEVSIPGTPQTLPSRRSSPALKLFVGVIAALTCYHVFKQGIPIFADNPEIARFDFTSSGFFGIPGRIFLFGMPFCVLLVSLAANRNLLPVSRGLFIAVWGMFTITNSLAGFKGGLISVFAVMLLMRAAAGKPIPLLRMVAGWRMLFALFAVLYAAAIALTYSSLNFGGRLESFVPYAVWRVTRGAAEPGHLAMRFWGTDGTHGEQFLSDAEYFFSKYFGPVLGTGGSEVLFTFEKEIAAAQIRAPLSQNIFLPPVTIGAYPELAVNFGIPMACICLFLSGILFSYLLRKCVATRNALKSTILAFAVYFVQIYLVNGNLMYGLFNFSLMTLMLSALYFGCRLLLGGRRATAATIDFPKRSRTVARPRRLASFPPSRGQC